MPTARPFASYPLGYTDLFLRARSKPIIIPHASPDAARRMRDRLYSFRTAALADLHSAGRLALVLPLAKMSLEGSQLTIYYPAQEATAHVIPISRISGKAR